MVKNKNWVHKNKFYGLECSLFTSNAYKRYNFSKISRTYNRKLVVISFGIWQYAAIQLHGRFLHIILMTFTSFVLCGILFMFYFSQLCFSRQFWSSINHADYMALRLGFLTTHELPFTYDFHNYMVRSMEEEFRDIVGISIPLWVFAISCIVLGFHGTNIYFWLSLLPIILILLVGTKLHHVVVKLAVEIMDSSQWTGLHKFKLRDELFWFGNPMLLLRLIQFVSFQNAFEMAMYIWSLWEIKEPSCYSEDRRFIVIRLTFGVVSQIWCSFITFPLYVIVTQMGSKFKKTIVSENVRKSLHGWRRKVKKTKPDGTPFGFLPKSVSVDSMTDLEDERISSSTVTTLQECSSSSQGRTLYQCLYETDSN